ncbi:hypothetical protein Hanom_Chr14g01264661 [Helianthus anomalus]
MTIPSDDELEFATASLTSPPPPPPSHSGFARVCTPVEGAGWIEESEDEDPSETEPVAEIPVVDTLDIKRRAGKEPMVEPSSNKERVEVEPRPSFRPTYPHFGRAHGIFTRRKTVGPPRKRKLVARDSSPTPKVIGKLVEQPANGTRSYVARRWGWLADQVQRWTDEEGVRPAFEDGESSTASRVLPLTGQTVERTVPLLAARCARHETRLNSLQGRVRVVGRRFDSLDDRVDAVEKRRATEEEVGEAMQSQITELKAEMADMKKRIEDVEYREVVALQRVDALEQRIESTVALAIICILLASTALQMGALTRFTR